MSKNASRGFKSPASAGEQHSNTRLIADGGTMSTNTDCLTSHPANHTVDCSIDTVCAILGNERRRMAIREFAAREPDASVHINELTETIARSIFGDGVTSKQRKRVYVALYQTHVEKLVDAGAIEYVDKKRNVYRPGENVGDLRAILDAIDGVTGGGAE